VTTVLCGVGGDTGNVRPVPQVDSQGRVEYLPIPEKGPTDGAATYGDLPQRHGDGTLADLLAGVRPNSDGSWITDADDIRDQPVHRDPNFAALTYGEHRPGYVTLLRELSAGDVVGFYGGFPGPETEYKHRYLFGYFTVAAEPLVLEPGMSTSRKAEILSAHPENGHAKRFAGNGDLYYHDPEFTDRPRPVVIVPGREPGGLLESAIKLSDRRRGPNYYMAEDIVERLAPQRRTDHGVHLGGFKPAVPCEASAAHFEQFVQEYGH
jgi:hypothetical protein